MKYPSFRSSIVQEIANRTNEETTNKELFEIAYEVMYPSTLTWVERTVGKTLHGLGSDDIAAEIWSKVWSKFELFSNENETIESRPARLVKWIQVLSGNVIIDRIRRAQTVRMMSESTPWVGLMMSEAICPKQEFEAAEMRVDMEATLMRLMRKSWHRRGMGYAMMQSRGMDLSAMAEATQSTRSAVKSSLGRFRKEMREALLLIGA